jgi:sugar lactone lactonase YvrE
LVVEELESLLLLTGDPPLTAGFLTPPHGIGTPVPITLNLTGGTLSSPTDPAFSGGILYVPNAGNDTISTVTPGGVVSTYADSGLIGAGTTPDGVTVGPDGNLYVTLFHDTRILQLIPPPGGTGPPTVKTFATGLANGNGPVFGPDNNLYVCDKYDNKIYQVTPAGQLNLFVDSNQGLKYPIALAFDGPNLFVASQNNSTIFEVSSGGSVQDFVDNTSSGGLINGPTSLVLGPDGNLYVYNSGSSEITTVSPSKAVSHFVKLDSAAAGPYAGLAFDNSGNLYVTNWTNNTISRITPPPLVEGQPFTNQTVFHFTDADPNGTPSQYTATVMLGDGNSVTLNGSPSAQGQIVANPAGGFDVRLSYTYAEELSNRTFSVQVNDVGGASTSASMSTFSVDDAPLTGSSAAVASGSVDVANSSILSGATFTDANPGNHSGDFTAVINWGDGGPTSSGTVSYDTSSGNYTVSGAHSYATAGSHQFTIAVTDDGGRTATITGTATVAAGTPAPPVPLMIIGEKAIFRRKTNMHGKPVGKAVLTGFSLIFNEPLNVATATNRGDYQLATVTIRKVKKKPTTILKPITNFTVSYDAAMETVNLTLIGKQAFPTGGKLTVIGTPPNGVSGASGALLGGPTVFGISKNGKTIAPSH